MTKELNRSQKLLKLLERNESETKSSELLKEIRRLQKDLNPSVYHRNAVKKS